MHIHIIISSQFSPRRPPLGLDQSFSFTTHTYSERRLIHMDEKTKQNKEKETHSFEYLFDL